MADNTIKPSLTPRPASAPTAAPAPVAGNAVAPGGQPSTISKIKIGIGDLFHHAKEEVENKLLDVSHAAEQKFPSGLVKDVFSKLEMKILNDRAKEAIKGGENEEEEEGMPHKDPDVSPITAKTGGADSTDPAVLKKILDAAAAQAKKPVSADAPSWTNVGPSVANSAEGQNKVVSGRISSILADPTKKDAFVIASADGGIYRTEDAGKNWTSLSAQFPTQSIGAMAMDPKNSNNLYVGLGDTFRTPMPGFMRSTDGGKTWSDPVILTGTYTGDPAPVTAINTRDVRVSSSDPNVVMVATNTGMFRSTDAGKSFKMVELPKTSSADPKSQPRHFWSIADLGGGQLLAAGKDDNSNGSIWKSTDNGATWQKSDLGALEGKVGRMTIAVGGEGANQRVYIQAADPKGTMQADVLKSSDGGKTFVGLGVNKSGKPVNPNKDQSDLDVMHGQAWYNQMIAVDPKNPDNVLIGGNLAAIRTNDGGKTWGVESDWRPAGAGVNNDMYVHADFHNALIVGSGKDQKVIVGSDGGLAVSDHNVFDGAAGAAKWDVSLNKGLTDQLVSSVGTSDVWNDAIIGGLQDNGTMLRTAATSGFNEVVGGDGWGVAVGHNPNIMLASVNGVHARSSDGGKTWDTAESGLPQFKSPFDVRYAAVAGDQSGKTFLTIGNMAADQGGPGGPNAGPAGVFITKDGGASWKSAIGSVQLRDGSTAKNFPGAASDVTASTGQPNVFGVMASGLAYLTSDGGKTWKQSAPIDPSLPAGSPAPALSSMAFDPSDPSGKTAFVVRGGSSAPHVFQTKDGGDTWAPVVGTKEHGLPDVPTDVIRVDPSNPKNVYVGNALGVYQSKDGGATWDRFGKDLPNVEVSGIAIKPDGSALRISTYGRGFWELTAAQAAQRNVA